MAALLQLGPEHHSPEIDLGVSSGTDLRPVRDLVHAAPVHVSGLVVVGFADIVALRAARAVVLSDGHVRDGPSFTRGAYTESQLCEFPQPIP